MQDERYWLTPKQKDQRKRQSKGICEICEKKMKNWRFLNLDHDHLTGRVRGVICLSCNVKLGFVEKGYKMPDESMLVYMKKYDITFRIPYREWPTSRERRTR